MEQSPKPRYRWKMPPDHRPLYYKDEIYFKVMGMVDRMAKSYSILIDDLDLPYPYEYDTDIISDPKT
jgi:hypothetical protein